MVRPVDHAFRVFLSVATMDFVSSLLSSVDWSKDSLYISIFAIAFNPTAWNIVARNGTCKSCDL